MTFNDVTDSQAVLSAIAECDELGRDRFLEKYGFSRANRYFLIWNGREYDSKAILAVAHGYQFQQEGPLGSGDFSGGANTVQKKLEELGFEVAVRSGPLTNPFVIGRTYDRGSDIHANFGGQEQGGISTPADTPFIFLFTGETGSKHGYSDGWDEEGVYLYTGEGQVGDMEFERGNKAIRDHARNGKDLLLFEDMRKGKGVKFRGTFACASWEYRTAPDREGNSRKAIVFHLVPMQANSVPEETEEPAPPEEIEDIQALRKAAYEASKGAVQKKEGAAKSTYYQRSAAVRDYVLARANGYCELCGEEAPFKRDNGVPYLEAHHIRRVSDGGPDDPSWVGAICPNCHRACHYSERASILNDDLKSKILSKEPGN